MSLLQNLTHTIYYQLDTLKSVCPGLIVQYGLPTSIPAKQTIALEHERTKADVQHELAGYRKRPRVFIVDMYTLSQIDRNDIAEAIKDLFENKTYPVLDATKNDTGVVMVCDGVRIEVDLVQKSKARAKIYVYTLINY